MKANIRENRGWYRSNREFREHSQDSQEMQSHRVTYGKEISASRLQRDSPQAAKIANLPKIRGQSNSMLKVNNQKRLNSQVCYVDRLHK